MHQGGNPVARVICLGTKSLPSLGEAQPSTVLLIPCSIAALPGERAPSILGSIRSLGGRRIQLARPEIRLEKDRRQILQELDKTRRAGAHIMARAPQQRASALHPPTRSTSLVDSGTSETPGHN